MNINETTCSFPHADMREDLLRSTEFNLLNGVKYEITEVPEGIVPAQMFVEKQKPIAILSTIFKNTISPYTKDFVFPFSAPITVNFDEQRRSYSFTSDRPCTIYTSPTELHIKIKELAGKMLRGEIEKKLKMKADQLLFIDGIDFRPLYEKFRKKGEMSIPETMKLINYEIASSGYKFTFEPVSRNYPIKFAIDYLDGSGTGLPEHAEHPVVTFSATSKDDFNLKLIKLNSDTFHINLEQFALGVIYSGHYNKIVIPPEQLLIFDDIDESKFATLAGICGEMTQPINTQKAYDAFMALVNEKIPETHFVRFSDDNPIEVLLVWDEENNNRIAFSGKKGFTIEIIEKSPVTKALNYLTSTAQAIISYPNRDEVADVEEIGLRQCSIS